jgi:hypothetical protein
MVLLQFLLQLLGQVCPNYRLDLDCLLLCHFFLFLDDLALILLLLGQLLAEIDADPLDRLVLYAWSSWTLWT